jgi:pyruvate, water dikinase
MSEEGEKKRNGNEFIRWFSELGTGDVPIAGGKGSSLGEMYNNKFPIPEGFVVTTEAYKHFIVGSGIDYKIVEILKKVDVEDTEELQAASKQIREAIRAGEMPADLNEAIIEAYEILDVDKNKIKEAGAGALGILNTGHEPPFVAVRSSATTEDLDDASFAGQQESFLNVKGNKDLLLKVRDCFSSLFTARAIYYRDKKGFDHGKAYLAVVIQKMIDSEKSGVIFSQNPLKGDGSILIEAVWGLGEGIVSGKIKPDQYIVAQGEDFNVLKTSVNNKKIAIVRNSSGQNSPVKLTEEKGKKQVLSSYEIKILSQYAMKLEEHYAKPQDIEFAIAGSDIFIVQSRPITTKAAESGGAELSGDVLVSGLGASPGVASGSVKIILDLKDLSSVKKGDVLVTEMTNPDMVVAMQRSAGIVTNEGGATSHAAIVSREMGIPAVVGTGNATEKLKEEEEVTVDGNNGKVFRGKAQTKLAEVNPVVETKTKIKVIVDLPDFAARAAKSGVKAVGLTRLEGLIASSGKHPLKYVKEGKIEDYVSVLVEGLSKILAPFEEIWIRSSDIRSDEYRNLEGSPKEVEGNPMMGDHGIRFGLKHPEILKAEFTAAKEIADDFPQKKIGIMIPLVISVDELKKAKALASEIGMPKNVKIGIMVETPAAVQTINSFCEEGIDFVSFGTNDLTQFTLAIDRNNSQVQEFYNEMHPGVLNSIGYVIRRCKNYGVETSICGQAGSKPEMAKFLLRQGIDSISVNADAARKISEVVAQIESGEGEVVAGKVEEKKEEKVETKKEEKVESLEPEIEVPERREEFIIPQMKMVEEEEEDALGKVAAEISKQPQPDMGGGMEDKVSKEDVEELALRELEGDDYVPSNDEGNKGDVPPLNEAISVDSDHLDSEEVEKKEIEVSSEELVNESDSSGEDDLGEEWEGERK